jgi:hypothetical protein
VTTTFEMAAAFFTSARFDAKQVIPANLEAGCQSWLRTTGDRPGCCVSINLIYCGSDCSVPIGRWLLQL